MKNIKSKKKLLKFLDELIKSDKNFKMPKFSEIAKNSKIFSAEYKKLISILRKGTKNFKDEMMFDLLVLNIYFSSTKVRARIKELNNKFYKETNNMNIQKPIFRKQKSIYKDIKL